MPDKVDIVAQNCWVSENQDIRNDMGRIVKEAYIRGFKRGVEKAKKTSADVRERVPVENVMEYRPVKYDPDEFFHHKQTNADRIRQMSDEELAERFASACPPKDAMNRCCQYYLSGSNGCKDCWLDWLQQEVET